jgi:polyisoprenoid-binding protein YceI
MPSANAAAIEPPLRRALCAIALAIGCGAAAHADPVQYRFDPTHTFVHFELLHFGTATLRGRFGPLQGEAELDRAAKTGRVQMEIDTAQVSTGVPMLDARIREPDMLSVKAHPKAYFVAEKLTFDDAGRLQSLRGEFTLRGASVPLELKAQRFNCYTSPLFRHEVCGGDFEGLPFVGDTVRLLVQVEGLRAESP